MKVTRISLVNVMAVQKAEVKVENNKLLLYGPNAAGKSSLMYGLLALISGVAHSDYVAEAIRGTMPGDLVRRGAGKAVVEAEIDGERYVLEMEEGGRWAVVHGNVRYRSRAPLLPVHSVAYVDPCAVKITRGAEFPLCGGARLDVGDPEIAECLNGVRHVVELEGVYYNYAKRRGVWLPTALLAYGHRRALGILTALCAEPDLMFVEAFEAGLHYDLAVALLHRLSKAEGFVAVESHVALTVKAALKHGWTVYYVREGEFSRVESLHQLKQVAEAEAEAYAAAT